MSDRDLLAVVGRQRACREFRSEPVDDTLVEQVLTAATHAPSAENAQPWEFVVVRDEAIRSGIGDLMARAWAAGGRDAAHRRLDPRLLADVDRGLTGGVAAAPVLVVVAADLERTREEIAASSIFPAVQNLLLAATALGLGSALTTIATAYADELSDLVGLPRTVRPMAVVPLGYPARALGPPRREPVREHAHRDRYGRPW